MRPTALELLAGFLEPIVLRVVDDDGGELVYVADVTPKRTRPPSGAAMSWMKRVAGA